MKIIPFLTILMLASFTLSTPCPAQKTPGPKPSPVVQEGNPKFTPEQEAKLVKVANFIKKGVDTIQNDTNLTPNQKAVQINQVIEYAQKVIKEILSPEQVEEMTPPEPKTESKNP